jgi:hypothetical protein
LQNAQTPQYLRCFLFYTNKNETAFCGPVFKTKIVLLTGLCRETCRQEISFTVKSSQRPENTEK